MMRSLVAHALAIALTATLAACGGGGGGGSSTPVTPPATTQNIQPIVVDAGPSGLDNILFTTVTICAPGGSMNCQTIDHIQIDTGSNGLRIISSVLSPAPRCGNRRMQAAAPSSRARSSPTATVGDR
jgi:hypothetical protein